MSESTKTGSRDQKTPGIKVPRSRTLGDIRALRQKHWAALNVAYGLMKAEGVTLREQLSCVHAINQASGSYQKLLEQVDLAEQLKSLKKEIEELRKSDHLRRVA